MFTAFLVALFVGLLLSLIFMPLRRRSGGLDALWFFVVIFLGTWAFGSWLKPFSPVWGVPWLGFVFIGIVLAVLLSAATVPPGGPPAADPPGRAAPDRASDAAAATAFGTFFWILVALFLLAIVMAAR